MAEDTAPLLFPFIKLRYERFGGLVFNPFLNKELMLDRREAYIAGLCDGKNLQVEIARLVEMRFSLGARDSERLVDRTIDRLMGAMALDRYSPVISDAQGRPEMPSFSRKGPFFSAPNNVVWSITHLCNLRCSHCLNGSGMALSRELDTTGALELVDRISDAGIFSVVLSGGEPFMRQDIFTVLQRIADADLRAEVITNGLRVTDEVVRALSRLPVYNVRVSIDGLGRTHDEIRGRNGAFKAACNAIRRLRRAGIGVSMNVTINTKNLVQVDSLIDLAVELGCDNFFVDIFLPIGRGKEHPELALDMAQLLDASHRLTERKRELEGTLHLSGESSSSFLFGRRPGKDLKDGPAGCSAGHDTLHIGADGTVYPCPFLLDFPLGNVRTSSIREIWNEAPVLQTLRGLRKKDMGEPCGSCGYSPKPCGCGCRAAAYQATGDITAADITCFMPLLRDRIIP